ncbi:MAG: hypothetical protein JNN29_14800, partial [Chitinophagaceae bacterium]|nr:hypothetical protein [Chitinophagaceae bacterium]
VIKIQLSGYLVVFLVECPARDEDANGHAGEFVDEIIVFEGNLPRGMGMLDDRGRMTDVG